MHVVLVSTIYDPQGKLIHAMRESLSYLRTLYSTIYISATYQTNPDTLALLSAHDAQYTQSERGIGEGRRGCVRIAYDAGAELMHYCDFDRILHWARTYPDELADLLPHLNDYDCTILGRTPRAFETHPQCQLEPERLTNRAFSVWLGQEVDVTTASRGLSRAAAKVILQQSTAQHVETDTEWPALCHRAGLSIGYRITEGLEWETPDYLHDQIAAAGSYAAWLRNHDANMTRWQQRTQIALDSIAVLAER